MRLPIRARLALVTAALSAIVLGAGAFLLYVQLESGLLEAVDAGLRSRAEALVAAPDAHLGSGGLAEPDEAFAQVLESRGPLGTDLTVLESSPGIVDRPLLSENDLRWGIGGGRSFQRFVQTVEEQVEARLFAVPIPDGRVLVVGASLDDQNEALARLRALLLVGGPLAVLLIAGVGWVVAGVALRPVERMREEAAAISASELDRRLTVPDTRDELARLGSTLNEMLARLEESLRRERRFVDDASHELRTPLANLMTELELALRRSRSAEDLEAALRSAAEETESLSRLAEDLLVLARTNEGRLPVRREVVDLGGLVDGIVEAFRPRALEAGVEIAGIVNDGASASVDPVRMRQAVGNLVDNALRHTARGGRVTVRIDAADGMLSLAVEDTGPGFEPEFLSRAFEPFARPGPDRGRPDGGPGLGLAIVRAVAEAHGGAVEAANRHEGGATVTLRVPG